MKTSLERRFLSLLLAAIMVLAVIPASVIEASAAGLAETYVIGEKIAMSSSDGGLGSVLDNGGGSYTFKIGPQEQGNSCDGFVYTGQTHTITITNKTADSVDFKFSYEASNNCKAFTVAGENKIAALRGTWEGTLAGGSSITVALTGPDKDEEASVIISGFEEASTDTFDVTVKHDANGTVTVNGSTISQDTTVSTTFAEGVAVTASPKSGYIFLGWKDANDRIVSAADNTTIRPDGADLTVTPVFVLAGATPYWCTNGTVYMDLNAAAQAAKTGDGVVYLMNDAILPAGNYEIPKGVTVLIPFDSANTIAGPSPEVLEKPNGYVSPYRVYRTLTIQSGVTLTVNGNLEVGAKHLACHGGYIDGGTPYDYYGKIVMENGSAIQVNDGGCLYAWGYITGTDAAIAAGNVTATVTAKNGAKIYEKMQVSDYRGGRITSAIVLYNCFPFNQYYIQNVEVKEVLEHGSTLVAHAGIYGDGIETSVVDFMGNSDAMFVLGTSTVVTKYYDHKTDRLMFEVEGDVSMNAISIMDYDTSKFVLPFNQNLTLTLKSGTATINQDIMLQPGATLNVNAGAKLVLASGKKIILMDNDGWGNYCFGKQIQQISYVPYYGGVPGIRQADTTGAAINMGDATINVNGTFEVNGTLYASGSGAKIISSGETGVVKFIGAAATGTFKFKQSTVQAYTFGGNTVDVTVNPGKLTHGDGTTLDTTNIAAGTNYNYCASCDIWYTGVHKVEVNFVDHDGETELFAGEFCIDTVLTDKVADPTRASDAQYTYTFDGWTSSLDTAEEKTVYKTNELPNATANVTYTATYTGTTRSYMITWYDEDGTQLTSKEFEYGAEVAYPETELPAKDDIDDCHYYEFKGWAATQGGAVLETIPAVTGEASYYAVFELKTRDTHDTNKFVYIDNEDGTHTKKLECCGEVVETVEHDFTNGDCVCGAKAPVTDIDVTAKGKITYSVEGNVVTVTHTVACKVGYWDEAAGKYVAIAAVANGDGSYSFTAPEGVTEVLLVVKGDVTGDGRVNVADKAQVNAAALRKTTLPAEATFAADVTLDGRVNVADKAQVNAVALRKTAFEW